MENNNNNELNNELNNEVNTEVNTSVASADENNKEAANTITLKQKLLKEVKEWVVSILVALVAVWVLTTFFFMPIRVDGKSMYPTLDNGERLGVTVLDVKLGYLERNDIVICHYPDRGRTFFVKRLVGVPGDTIKCVNGVTYVNDTALDPDLEKYNANGSRYDYDDYVLGEDEYFVVGDNRYNSHDSRTWQGRESSYNGLVGPISKSMIVGKARFVFWPISGIRGLNNQEYIPE